MCILVENPRGYLDGMNSEWFITIKMSAHEMDTFLLVDIKPLAVEDTSILAQILLSPVLLGRDRYIAACTI